MCSLRGITGRVVVDHRWEQTEVGEATEEGVIQEVDDCAQDAMEEGQSRSSAGEVTGVSSGEKSEDLMLELVDCMDWELRRPEENTFSMVERCSLGLEQGHHHYNLGYYSLIVVAVAVSEGASVVREGVSAVALKKRLASSRSSELPMMYFRLVGPIRTDFAIKIRTCSGSACLSSHRQSYS